MIRSLSAQLDNGLTPKDFLKQVVWKNPKLTDQFFTFDNVCQIDVDDE